jgi:hypothetical protein
MHQPIHSQKCLANAPPGTHHIEPFCLRNNPTLRIVQARQKDIDIVLLLLVVGAMLSFTHGLFLPSQSGLCPYGFLGDEVPMRMKLPISCK